MDKKKVLFIINPCAGRDKTRKSAEEIISLFPQDEYEFTVEKTTCRGDATNIVRRCLDGNDMVICCGGDGTFNETVNGVLHLQSSKPVGYIPMGSTNDLASTIGIPTNIQEAVDVIKSGYTNTFDIGCLNGRFFTYVASFGPATSLSYSTSQKLKNKLGHAAYMINGFVLRIIPTLKEVKPIHIKFEYDGGVFDDIFYFASVSNATSVGGLFRFNKDAVKLNDGKFEVLLVKNLKSPLDPFRMLAKMIKKDYDGKSLIFFKTSQAKFTFDEPHAWTLDGEFGGEHKTVSFSVLPGAVTVYSPQNPMFVSNEEPEKEPAEIK